MNRLAVSAAVILIILTSAVCSCVTLTRAVNVLEQNVSECIDYCQAGDKEKALEKAKEISDISRKHSTLFNIFLNHNDFDELFTSLNMLPVFAQSDTDELYITASQCLCQLQYAHRYITASAEMIF